MKISGSVRMVRVVKAGQREDGMGTEILWLLRYICVYLS